MAGLKNADDFQNGERFKGAGLFGIASLVVGVVAIAAFFIIAFSNSVGKDEALTTKVAEVQEDVEAGVEKDKEKKKEVKWSKKDAMAYSWLFAVVFFLSLGVGGMFWTLLHHASNSGWGTVVRRLMENLGIMIPVMMFLALPLVLEQFGFRDSLWEWFSHRENVEFQAKDQVDKDLQKEDNYLTQVRGKAQKAVAELDELKKKKDSVANISKGHARFFEDQIAKLGASTKKLQDHAAKTDDELIKEMKLKYFKDNETLLYMKKSFLEEKFWLLRFCLYLIVLGGGIFMLRSLSVKQDKIGGTKLFTKLRGRSCLILLPFAVAWTFLVFDWLMALDYAWFSTMWGVYLFAGAALNSMAFLILMVSLLRRAGYLKNVVTKEHYHIMGKLMHAFVIFWAYIAFSQFFLIWYANITEETKFFLMRNTGFWNTYTIIFLVVGHFFVPFLILLVRYCKTTVWIVCAVCLWNLLMHFFDIYWIIISERAPSLTHGALNRLPGMWAYDLLAFVGVGGIFIFCLLKALGSASLYPCRDPRLDESLNLTN